MALRGRAQPFRPNRAPVWYPPSLTATADISSGSGQAISPGVELVVQAGMAVGSGGGVDPSVIISPTVNVALGSALTLDPALILILYPGVGSGSGLAVDPEVLGTNGVARAGLASGTGLAFNPNIQIVTNDGAPGDGYPWLIVNAGIALGSGGALDSTVTGNNTIALAGIALGAGGALTPIASISGQHMTVLAGIATGSGVAYDARFVVFRYFPVTPFQLVLLSNGITSVDIIPG